MAAKELQICEHRVAVVLLAAWLGFGVNVRTRDRPRASENPYDVHGMMKDVLLFGLTVGIILLVEAL